VCVEKSASHSLTYAQVQIFEIAKLLDFTAAVTYRDLYLLLLVPPKEILIDLPNSIGIESPPVLSGKFLSAETKLPRESRDPR
jgi:hypothetical protein